MSPPACIAAKYSAADGITNLRFACAKIGAVGMVASTAGMVASLMVSVSCVGSVSIVLISGSSCGILAAMSVIIAPANAGTGTSDNSIQSAAVTVTVPSLAVVYLIGFTPTDTESKTPSCARINASSPACVLLILAVNIMPSGVSTRSVTMPMALVESWFMYRRGALPSTGRLPASKITDVPSATVAATP